MKYDDASWHYDGDFPEGLPDEAGATHFGMFLAWLILNGMASDELLEDSAGEIADLKARKMTPGAFVMNVIDEKFTDQDANEEGNAFTLAYFQSKSGEYLTDYEEVLANGLPSLYNVSDTWENFDTLRPLIDRRYAEWKSGPKPPSPPEPVAHKPWWKFW